MRCGGMDWEECLCTYVRMYVCSDITYSSVSYTFGLHPYWDRARFGLHAYLPIEMMLHHASGLVRITTEAISGSYASVLLL